MRIGYQTMPPRVLQACMQGSRGSQSVVEALRSFQSGLRGLAGDTSFSNANDCHDDKGQFCEGGGSSSGGVGKPDMEPIRVNDKPGTLWNPETKRSGEALPSQSSVRMVDGKMIDTQTGRSATEWADRVLTKSEPKPKKTGGIGPERSIATAEKRAKEYGYAKKVSFYQCKNVDQANEINTQLAELSDDTGMQLERVYVYKGGGKAKEAPKSALGYQQTHKSEDDSATLGFQDGVTAQYCASRAFNQADIDEDITRWQGKVGGPSGDFYQKAIAEAQEERQYKAYSFAGNGVRNPVVDHEFAHALVDRALISKPKSDMWGQPLTQTQERGYYINQGTQTKLNNLGDMCREFNREAKFSVYGSRNAPTSLFVKSNEPLAETYAFWKAGNEIPDKIVTGFKRLEAFRRPK